MVEDAHCLSSSSIPVFSLQEKALSSFSPQWSLDR